MTCQLKNGGAFLHVPKTGGTWVCAVLEKNGLLGTQLGIEHRTTHHEKWAFCVLREPVEWWLSLWRFRNDTAFEHMDAAHPLYPVNSWHEKDATQFITRAIEEGKGFCSRLFREYAVNSNYVLQTEDLKGQMQLLASRVGWNVLSVSVPRLNVSRERQVTSSTIKLFPKLRESESDARELWRLAGEAWGCSDN